MPVMPELILHPVAEQSEKKLDTGSVIPDLIRDRHKLRRSNGIGTFYETINFK